jgi:threonine/homoserine/homoserine lactone efflux protein
MESSSLVIFMLAGLALNVTPGPDMLYVAARATAGGRVAGIVSALGIAAGTMVHITLVAFGLASMLVAVPAAQVALRYLGAIYLVYLGVRAWMTNDGAPAPAAPSRGLRKVFWQGAVTNVLNPKVALFFLAFLPQFVDPVSERPALTIAVLGLVFNTTGTLVDVGVALAASSVGARIHEREAASRALHRVSGAVLVGLGLHLALASRR